MKLELTSAQAFALRVAILSFDADCGDDEHGLRMSAAYKARLGEVLKLLNAELGTIA